MASAASHLQSSTHNLVHLKLDRYQVIAHLGIAVENCSRKRVSEHNNQIPRSRKRRRRSSGRPTDNNNLLPSDMDNNNIEARQLQDQSRNTSPIPTEDTCSTYVDIYETHGQPANRRYPLRTTRNSST